MSAVPDSRRWIGLPNGWKLRSAIADLAWPALPGAVNAAMLSLLHQFDRTQWLSPDELLDKQLGQLRVLIRHAWDTVPHYRKAWGAKPDSEVNSADRFARLPLVARRELQDAGEAMRSRAVPRAHGPIHEARTSGSTGAPVRVFKTDIQGVLWSALTVRNHAWHGRDPMRRLAVLRHGVKQGAFPTWGPPMDRLVATGPADVMGMSLDVEGQFAWLQERKPQYLLTYPTVAAALARLSLARATPLPGLLNVATLGETLDAETRELCRTAWGVSVTDGYSAEEVGYIALQCPEREHYHVQSESVLVEILDEQDRPCRPGEIGRVVVTDLHNFAMPLVRYDIGDYAEVGEPCPCGRGLPTIKRILGRVRNMLVTADGRRYWPTFGRRALTAIDALVQYQFVQTAYDHVEARLVLRAPLTASQEQQLVAAVGARLPAGVRLSVVPVPSLPRSPGGKFEEFVCAVPEADTPR
ncbi:MAG TPA: hypothetical protein VM489_15930 [Burkholderiales bacterium]|nr:hypothetical protein [Burkholderiales bacterium]